MQPESVQLIRQIIHSAEDPTAEVRRAGFCTPSFREALSLERMRVFRTGACAAMYGRSATGGGGGGKMFSRIMKDLCILVPSLVPKPRQVAAWLWTIGF